MLYMNDTTCHGTRRTSAPGSFPRPTPEMVAVWAAEHAARPAVEKAVAQYNRGMLSLTDLRARLDAIAAENGL